MADKKNMQEAVVRELPPDLPDENIGAGDPLSNLPSIKVDASDVEPDPRHAGPDKLGRPARPDPNAALRKARGVGPGLQDSEIINPAVWVDQTSDEARKAAADAYVADAERELDRAKATAKAVKAGDPQDREIP